MIIFFTLGGGTFIAAFVLIMVSAIINELGKNTNSFISENVLLIMIISIVISIIGSILGAKLWGSKKSIPPIFLMIIQFFFFLIRGLYYVTSDPYESSFLMLFSFGVYIAALVFDGFVMLATAGITCDKKRIWPLYLAGTAGVIFSYLFW